MKNKPIILILIIISVQGCNFIRNEEFNSKAIEAAKIDYENYYNSLKIENNSIYEQLDNFVLKDTSLQCLIDNINAIRKHSVKLVSNLNKYQNQLETSNKLENITELKYQEAFQLKDDLTSFQVHVIYLNSKTTKSKELDERIKQILNVYDYFPKESWEKTLILEKSNHNLLMIVEKLKFEVVFAENTSARYWLETLKEKNYAH